MARKIAFAIYLVVAIVVMAFLLALNSEGVRVTSDADDEPEVRPGPPPHPVPPPPPPAPSGALQRYVSRVRVEGPYSDRGLTVFTLSTHSPETHVNYLTLDEGSASGQLVVQEVGGGSVPVLQAQNRSDRWAFVMSGELVAGGKQNRALRSDALLPPHSTTWFNLPVYCIEQHRWNSGARFGSAKAAAPNTLRSGLNQGYDQARVWTEAARAQKAAGVSSSTGDVTVLYTDDRTAKQVDEIARRLIRLIPRRQYVGLVVARGPHIVSADLFANSSLYSRLYEKVIRSHAVEVLSQTYTGYPTTGEVHAFLNRVHGAYQTVQPAPNGYGRTLRLHGNGIGGEALEHDGRCIHAALFPQMVRPIPMPHPAPERDQRR
ncbi:MAG TPA: DUF6569 family protein [Planctomycetota bacterium]|nr:DUF6569 family protein [Planctomycetota bacterium]